MVPTKVILLGIGGPSSAGKSTLAKHLSSILSTSLLIHQDDFFPLPERVPFHPLYQVLDWDSPATAIDWPRFIDHLLQVRKMGKFPVDHHSFEEKNQNPEVPINEEVKQRWSRVFIDLQRGKQRLLWVIVDGFLLYWKPEVIQLMDIQVMLRAPRHVLKQRRQNRQWHAPDSSKPNGLTISTDPPDYWENIAWPAYKEAHKHLFCGEDVENGHLRSSNLTLLDMQEINMTEAVARTCALLKDFAERI